jgi:hypothetical protein
MIRIADPTAWRGFALSLAAAAAGLAASLYAFVVALDPYGIRAGPGAPPSPLMDLNQRFMYPQVVRSGRFDAAIFGTSTVRLLDPKKLGSAFGASFANLGLNAGTPWEQLQLAELFLRHVPRPKALIFGLDRNWCEEDADRKKLTFRAFPPWLYDDSRLDDYLEVFNLTSLEIAGRMALHRLGLMPERIRGDGYEVFVPDEAQYDLSRARLHLYRQGAPSAALGNDVRLSLEERTALRFPALDWLEDFLARVPASSAMTLATMPIHMASQPPAGTREAAVDAECKARVTALGRSHGAAVVDFRVPSTVTTEDSNYWDPLHYRVGIADRIVVALADAYGAREATDGFYRLLAPPARQRQPPSGTLIRSAR